MRTYYKVRKLFNNNEIILLLFSTFDDRNYTLLFYYQFTCNTVDRED